MPSERDQTPDCEFQPPGGFKAKRESLTVFLFTFVKIVSRKNFWKVGVGRLFNLAGSTFPLPCRSLSKQHTGCKSLKKE